MLSATYQHLFRPHPSCTLLAQNYATVPRHIISIRTTHRNVCECSVAVANALPAIKERVDFVTAGDHGAGVEELIEQLITSDLSSIASRLTRHDVPLGTIDDGGQIRLTPHGTSMLLVGT